MKKSGSKNTNTYVINGDILQVTTKKGDIILADSEDYERIRRYSWCISKTGYAVANTGNKVVKMHRYLLGLKNPKICVDHKNHNKLDNRKSNLRLCSQKDNLKNIGPKGDKDWLGIRLTVNGRYNVRITVDREQIHVGNYKTLEEAQQARMEAEEKYHGEFGYHNSMEK